MEPLDLENVLDTHSSWWGVQIAVLMLLAFVVSLVTRYGYRKTHRTSTTRALLWKEVWLQSAHLPIILEAWVLATGLSLQILYVHTQIAILSFVPTLQNLASIAIVSWFCVKCIKGSAKVLEHRLPKGGKVDKTGVRSASKLAIVSVMIVASIFALQVLGFSVSGLLAFGGVGGIVIGFAGKDLLANFFGGIMLHFDRPFAVGDWIRSPEKQIEGHIEHIGWRITAVRTFSHDKHLLYLPNALFSTIIIENASKMTHRRIYETVSLRYQDIQRVPFLLEDIRAYLKGHAEVDTELPLLVYLSTFAAYSVDLLIAVYIKKTDIDSFSKVKEEILLAISQLVTKHKAEFAFPTSQIVAPDPLQLHLAERSPS